MISVGAFYWDPQPEVFRLPVFDWPVFWYGIVFALGFAIGFPIFVGVLTRFLGDRAKAIRITDRFTLYMILGTVIGARVGHFLFYESPSHYLESPLEIFRTWRGGLASHGAAVGIVVAIWLFSCRVREPGLTWVRLLDFVAVPAAFIGGCIRIGNFINQEVLGTPSDLPWAVVFGHPADLSLPIARHPVQIYESLFYFAVFILLWKLSFKKKWLEAQGKMIGIFLILVFGFRFCVEFLKPEQSQLLSHSLLNMGQILSLPAILAGFIFYLDPFLRRRDNGL